MTTEISITSENARAAVRAATTALKSYYEDVDTVHVEEIGRRLIWVIALGFTCKPLPPTKDGAFQRLTDYSTRIFEVDDEGHVLSMRLRPR